MCKLERHRMKLLRKLKKGGKIKKKRNLNSNAILRNSIHQRTFSSQYTLTFKKNNESKFIDKVQTKEPPSRFNRRKFD